MREVVSPIDHGPRTRVFVLSHGTTRLYNFPDPKGNKVNGFATIDRSGGMKNEAG